MSTAAESVRGLDGALKNNPTKRTLMKGFGDDQADEGAEVWTTASTVTIALEVHLSATLSPIENFKVSSRSASLTTGCGSGGAGTNGGAGQGGI